MVVPGNRTAIVVDDESSIREMLERLLRHNGYQVSQAEDGESALKQAANTKFEVMLLDIGMPGLSGLDVLDRMSLESDDTAVIMITVQTDVESAVQAMKNGAYDFITKPFMLEDVLTRVGRALERRFLRNQERRQKSSSRRGSVSRRSV